MSYYQTSICILSINNSLKEIILTTIQEHRSSIKVLKRNSKGSSGFNGMLYNSDNRLQHFGAFCIVLLISLSDAHLKVIYHTGKEHV